MQIQMHTRGLSETSLQFIPYLYILLATVLAALAVGLPRAPSHTPVQLHNIQMRYTVLHKNHQALLRNIHSSCKHLCIYAHNSLELNVDRQTCHTGKDRNCFHNATHTCTAAWPLQATVAADALGWVEIDCNRGACKETALLSETNNRSFVMNFFSLACKTWSMEQSSQLSHTHS